MKYFVRSLAVLFLFLAPVAMAAQLPDFTELAETTGKAVVNISTVKRVQAQPNMQQFFRQAPRGQHPFGDFFDQFERFFGPQGKGAQREQRSLGSGFVLSSDGYIVTNNHVVEGADSIKVNLRADKNGERSYDAEVVGTDKETDLALLKIKSDVSLPHLPFGDSDALKVGQWVMAIGNPFGLDHTVTAGIVSAKGRTIGAGPYDNFIQTDERSAADEPDAVGIDADELFLGMLPAAMRRAIAAGMDPMRAIRLATLTPAAYFNLRRCGALAPGRRADVVVRITSDCPLIDPGLIDQVIAAYEEGSSDYVSNMLPPTWPYGMAVEVFSAAALAQAHAEATPDAEREHVGDEGGVVRVALHAQLLEGRTRRRQLAGRLGRAVPRPDQPVPARDARLPQRARLDHLRAVVADRNRGL